MPEQRPFESFVVGKRRTPDPARRDRATCRDVDRMFERVTANASVAGAKAEARSATALARSAALARLPLMRVMVFEAAI